MGGYWSREPVVDERVEIDISCKQLEALPDFIRDNTFVFPHVLTFDASNNSIGEKLREAGEELRGIAKMNNVERVNLCNNKVEDISELYVLERLQYVNISHNKVKLFGEGMKGMKSLQEIIADNNCMERIPLVVCEVRGLCVLNLSFNSLKEIPKEIGALVCLKRLELQGNKIVELPKEIKNLKELKVLNASHNCLSSLPDELGELEGLQKLYVDHNNLGSLPSTFNKLKNLKELHVSNNEKLTAKFLTVGVLKAISKYCYVDIFDEPVVVPEEEAEASSSSGQASSAQNQPTTDQKRIFAVFGHSFEESFVLLINAENINNDSEAYIVDTGTAVYLKKCGYLMSLSPNSPLEYSESSPHVSLWDKALYVATTLAKDMGYKRVNVCEEEAFWTILGLRYPINRGWLRRWVITPPAVIDQRILDYLMQIKIFRFAKSSDGNVHVIMQAGTRPEKSQLVPDSCYVLDCGWDVAVWAGSRASLQQKKLAMQKAEQLLDSWVRPKRALITWELEGEEMILFKEQFSDWDNLSACKKPSEVFVDMSKPVVEEDTASEEDVVVLDLDKITEKKRQQRFKKLLPPISLDLAVDFSKVKFPLKNSDLVVKSSSNKENQNVNASPNQSPNLAQQKVPEKDNYSKITREKSTVAGQQKRAPTSKNPIRDRQARQAQHDEEAKDRESPRTKGKAEWDKLRNTLRVTGVALTGADEGKSSELSGPRLIQFHGRRNFLARCVEPVPSSVILGAAYLLDTGKRGHLYIWSSPKAARTATGAALALAKALRDKERPESRIINIEKGTDDSIFWELLGERPKQMKESVIDEIEINNRDHIILFQVRSKGKGAGKDETYELVEEARGVLYKETLCPAGADAASKGAAYVIDAGSEVYVWMSRSCPSGLRKIAPTLAEERLKGKKYWCMPVSKQFEGTEQVLFREKFANWGGALPIQMQQVPVGANVAPTRQAVEVDIKAMKKGQFKHQHAGVPMPEEDPGTGRINVWRVEEYKKVAIPESQYGQFYMAEAYVVLYTYVWKNMERYIIYFYQGRDTSINDTGASALLTIELDDLLNRQAKEVRVVEGKEPAHFMKIFKGKIMNHQGLDPDTNDPPSKEVAMYEVRGTDDTFLRAVQVFPNFKSLHHYHVFVVLNGKGTQNNTHYLWFGKLSNNHERKFAEQIMKNQGYNNIVVVEEGKENDEFWRLLGKHTSDQITYYNELPEKRHPPRLFQCSEASGLFSIEEIHPFVQEDLASDDVFILDGVSSMYVWAGKYSTEGERRNGMSTALKYVAEPDDALPANKQRDVKKLYYITEGKEPAGFAIHFHGWQFTPKRRMASAPVYDPKKYGPFTGPLTMVTDMFVQYTREYTYEELTAKKFPKGIDVTRLELYLSDSEFLKYFQVSKEEFEKYSDWKKEQMKKELNLF